jgi:hypothetical protein
LLLGVQVVKLHIQNLKLGAVKIANIFLVEELMLIAFHLMIFLKLRKLKVYLHLQNIVMAKQLTKLKDMPKVNLKKLWMMHFYRKIQINKKEKRKNQKNKTKKKKNEQKKKGQKNQK